MISGDLMYHGMNAVLGVVALVSVFLVPRLLTDGGAKRKLIAAFICMLVASITFSVCLRIFRLMTIAYIGVAVGKAGEGTFQFVDSFKLVALAGNALEVLAVVLIASVVKSLVGQQRAGVSEEEKA